LDKKSLVLLLVTECRVKVILPVVIAETVALDAAIYAATQRVWV
jgi:hypothetical protein